jgi:hypothetical protein
MQPPSFEAMKLVIKMHDPLQDAVPTGYNINTAKVTNSMGVGIYSLGCGWTTVVRFLAGKMKGNLCFTTVSGPALVPTQRPIQWVPGTVFRE